MTKPKKTRAKHACRECNARRVKCNVTERQPCTNCAASGATCEPLAASEAASPGRMRDSTQPPSSTTNSNTLVDATGISLGSEHDHSMSSPAHGYRHHSPRHIAPAPDQGAPTETTETPSSTSAAGTLFFGESNFLTLVPGDEAAAAGGVGSTPGGQKPRLTFPIPGSPGSQSQAEGAGISAGTMRYLRDEGALTLPDLQTCLPALQAYFTWFHPSFPILDRAEIARRLASMDISRFLLQCMLFIGATYCDDDTILAMGFHDRSEAKRLLYQRARLLFHADWEKDEITLIQSIFLMSFWRGGPADKPIDDYKADWMQVRERQVAVALGLPSRIRDEDCDVEPLSAGDLESETYCSTNPLFGFCQPEHITDSLKMVELAKLLGRIIDLQFSPGQPASTAEDVEGLDKALEAWRNTLPESMRCATDEGSESVWTCLLHLAYNRYASAMLTRRDSHLRILIHRNSFLKFDEGNKWNQVVTSAACRISRIAEDMSTHGTLRYGQMHLITSLFAALCIHAISIRRGMGVSRRIAEHRAQMCLLCLKEIQKYWRINNNVLDLFLQYLDRSIADRLHAAQADGAAGHGGSMDAGGAGDGSMGGTMTTKRSESSVATALSPSMPPPRGAGEAFSPGADHHHHSSQTGRAQDDLTLLEDQYFNLVHGHWEGDDALGDLGLFLQADDFAPLKGLNVLGRSL
ncbi:cutinase transcription factor 1 alpha [Purpureocillium lavendulum]|uniref:Cutinase transcription factor 1 alpha n=1 Tax=Purpureocillium lavendulum TaxID=1247861 RepID=A0AB34FL57_9HYPO|nr:cutinase transcription factor 1 alpha [Purpureocillium lavendulum]